MIKFFKKTFVTLSLLSLVFISCNEDLANLELDKKPNVSVDTNEITVTEGETATFNFTVDGATTDKIDIRIDILDSKGNPIPTTKPSNDDPTSGNGYVRIPLDDIFVPYKTWFQSGWFQYGYLGGSGYVATFAPGTLNFPIEIRTINDSINEGEEIITIRFSVTSLMSVTINETVKLKIRD